MPSRSMMTVWGMALAAYFSATAPSRSSATVGLQLVPLEHGRDLLGLFLQVDGDELHAPVAELAGDLLDLRHRLQAGAAPGGPEVEDDHLALVLGEAETWTRPAARARSRGPACRPGPTRFPAARPPAMAAVGLRGLRLGGVLQLPLLVGQLGRRLLDAAADQELVDFSEVDPARRPARRSCPRAVPPANWSASEGQPDAVVADGLHPRRRGLAVRSARPFGVIELVGMEPDDPRDRSRGTPSSPAGPRPGASCRPS